MGVQVRWDTGGTEPVDDYTSFYGNRNVNHHLGIGTLSSSLHTNNVNLLA
jgi:hypothetical protein